MAGSYPDAPGRRIAYDGDGTIVTKQARDYTPQEVLTASESAELNGNDADQNSGVDFGDNNQVNYLRFFFPEPRDIAGIYAASDENPGPACPVDVSADTTNGIDGTWTNLVPDLDWRGRPPTPDDWRTEITTVTATAVRAVRMTYFAVRGDGRAYPYCVHLYGQIASGETPDRLVWLDSANNVYTGPIDYGDIPRGSATDTTIRLRNQSATLTAEDVTLTAEALTGDSGDWYTFSEGGGQFTGTLTLGSSVGPGADSAAVTVRRVVPDAEPVGLHEGRLVAAVGSWV